MSSLRLHLPLHVRSEHILYVIGKCVGVPCAQKILGNRSPSTVDFSTPASATNHWHVRFQPEGGDFAVRPAEFVRDLSFCHIHFRDLAGNDHAWEFSPENEHEEYKLLYPDSCALSVAVARRLLRFFGGTLQYADTAAGKVDQSLSPSRALFPPRPKRSLHPVSPADRFDQFHNALHALPMLSSAEIHEAAELSAYGLTPACSALADRLLVEHAHVDIAQATKSRPTATPRRQRL